MREPVEIHARKAMTPARKRRIHALRKGLCWLCNLATPESGPGVQYDHRVPLALGGQDDDANLWPLHTVPCHALKTKADVARIAKAKRLEARENGTRRERQPIPSRGFDKTRTRHFDGTISLRGEPA